MLPTNSLFPHEKTNSITKLSKLVFKDTRKRRRVINIIKWVSERHLDSVMQYYSHSLSLRKRKKPAQGLTTSNWKGSQPSNLPQQPTYLVHIHSRKRVFSCINYALPINSTKLPVKHHRLNIPIYLHFLQNSIKRKKQGVANPQGQRTEAIVVMMLPEREPGPKQSA